MKGPKPKYGETMTTAIKISLTEKLEKDIIKKSVELRCKPVDYIRLLILKDLYNE
jgi:hypothetical protein